MESNITLHKTVCVIKWPCYKIPESSEINTTASKEEEGLIVWLYVIQIVKPFDTNLLLDLFLLYCQEGI